jgi:hypothetical protein
MSLSDLSVDAFLLLRDAFFDSDGSAKLFTLPDKRNTQDDPLDTHIASIFSQHLTDAICRGKRALLIHFLNLRIGKPKPRHVENLHSNLEVIEQTTMHNR